jgi:hypothetical protein
MKNILLSCLLTLALVGSAQAVTKNYKIGTDSSVTANSADSSGLVINTALDGGLAGYSFTLNDGQTATFDFFKIWTPEDYVNSDDKIAKTITAYLDFAIPDITASIPGSTVGISAGFFGFLQYGQVTWKDPVFITVDDRKFAITLDDATFNKGLFGLDDSRCSGAEVHAHVKQVCSKVPDSSATLALLGLSLLALAGLRRR